MKVCGVASQGRPGFIDQGGWFVKTYTIAYSKDGENWTNYKEFGIAKVKRFLGLNVYPSTPNMKEQILLSCPYTFLIKVLGRGY